ncbi:MAG: PAS domain S-box protein [Verrucomicrobia subdivision 3 bacterium]|nr:PAS domain S-box protein [Limisphaerales bacterium]
MDQPIKVLLIEDSPPDARLLSVYLSESRTQQFQITPVSRLAEALQRLGSEDFDVVVSDLQLPDSQGIATFEWLKAHVQDVPIIVLSGSDDEILASRAVREGAQDYLVKGRFDAHGLVRSITYAIERHRAEQALQESEKHYKFLLESITDYTYSVKLRDALPIKTVHGPGCISITGYSPDEYQADPGLWFRMVHEEDRAAVVAQVKAVQSGETPPPLEHRIIHKNGQIRWVRHTAVPSRDRTGRLDSYDGLIADITERKRAEEDLISSEGFYHSLVENLPQNILRKDLNERFTFANQRFCQMLGQPLEEIIGKTDFDFFPPQLAEKYQRDDRFVIRTGQTFETIEENQTPSGEKIYVNVIKTPIYDAKGQIIGIQGIFWDITERKRFEERLQKANEELAASEAALRKSHEELKAAQLQLIQAEKMEAIGTLAAGVAHEVKNPLAILMMGVNYLAKKLSGTDDNIVQVVKEMREAIDRADSITRGLLDFSASRQLAIRSEDLNQVIEETLRLVRHELNKKQIVVVKHLGERLPHVGVDKRQIQQVFVNIIVNSVHAMPEGGTLTVRTYSKQLTETSHFEGSRKATHFWVGDIAVIAEVEDTGTGIPEENLAKIFDPFFTTKPTGVGTGLGLPVTKKIIELHGGSMDIKNVSGGGVRVTIKLKAHRS